MIPAGETLNNHHDSNQAENIADVEFPPFDPENAQRLQSEARSRDRIDDDHSAERLDRDRIGAITAAIYTEDPLPERPEYQRSPDNPYLPPEEKFTKADLERNPARRFQVDPEEFPLFAMQQEYYGYNSHERKRLPLDETPSRYVGFTAGTVSVLAGEVPSFSHEQYLPADHVIYLDKSARPVSWLVDEFWEEFTDKPDRPEKSYLAIDRSPWFNAAGLDTDNDGRKPDGELATFKDFLDNSGNITMETLARVRALYIDGGIKSENPAEIFTTPTVLDGKVITIIDEVERTGSTVRIAKWLIENAIPGVKCVQTFGFWQSGFFSNSDRSDQRQASVPVWYDAVRKSGRGVGEINPEFHIEKYDAEPTDINRARKYGAFVLGVAENMAEEQQMSGKFGSPSVELYHEIQDMHREFRAGHILQMPTRMYNDDRYEEYVEQQGLVLGNDRFAQYVPANNVGRIVEELKKRKPLQD